MKYLITLLKKDFHSIITEDEYLKEIEHVVVMKQRLFNEEIKLINFISQNCSSSILQDIQNLVESDDVDYYESWCSKSCSSVHLLII